MELTEPIEHINRQLISLFGIDTVTGNAMWRVVWAEDELEKQLCEFSEKGVELLHPEVREVRKYSWIKGRYILEHLVAVPSANIRELPTQKITYTCIHVFEDKYENYLPPNIVACKFIVNLVLSAMGRARDGLSPIKKFIDEEYSREASLHAKAERLNKICEELYGEDASFRDNLLNGSGTVLSDNKRN